MDWLITVLVGFTLLFLPGYLYFRISGVKLEGGQLLLFSMAVSFTVPLVTAHLLNHFIGIKPIYSYIAGIVALPAAAFLRKNLLA